MLGSHKWRPQAASQRMFRSIRTNPRFAPFLSRAEQRRNYLRRRLQKYASVSAIAAALLARFGAGPSGGAAAHRLMPPAGRKLWRRCVRKIETRVLSRIHNSHHYRAPLDLANTPISLRRGLVIGSCMSHAWPVYMESADPACPADFILVNNLSEMPSEPPRRIADYDFQILQPPLRAVLPDHVVFRFLNDDPAAQQKLLDDAEDRLQRMLEGMLRWNEQHGLLTFITNFLVPQQNALGRLMPRYDLGNPMHLIERLNQALSRQIANYRNTYLLDIDQIAATWGKKFIQNDSLVNFNHGGQIIDVLADEDRKRIEPPERLDRHYELGSKRFVDAVWAEVVAMIRTTRQQDAVKLVAVDIDDTLWRGVGAEFDDIGPQNTDGWPLGLVEALSFLKRRGVLLALLSKNDDTLIAPIWRGMLGDRLRLEDFAVRKINWRPKAENMAEILRELNLLPRSVVFVDDHPVERAAMKEAFPDIRVLGSHPYFIRRVLLWAPETQVAGITQESARRTEMVQAQVERENVRQRLTREEFLSSLALQVKVIEIGSVSDRRFPRAFELLNKTNQFNTTGRRWTSRECAAAFANGHTFYAFEVEDRFTQYGLVGLVILSGGRIEQFVMSCRVVGMDVEIAAMAKVVERMRGKGVISLSANIAQTDANVLSLDLFQRCGFVRQDGLWVKPAELTLQMPAHIEAL